MKRLVQLVAVMIVALLAGLPAAEGLACWIHMAGHVDACPMGMSGMDPDCPVPRDVAANCEMECCNDGLPPRSAAWIASTKPKTVAVVAIAALAVDAPGVAPAPVPRTMESAATASPPRYILNCVFRI